MLVPLAAVDLDLALAAPAGPAVAARHRRARVLARWSGTPVGIVDVSVCDGHIRPADVFQALQQHHADALPREAVRRALRTTGVPARLDPAVVWTDTAFPRTEAGKISVAVCTRDRPEDLATCLSSLARLDPAPREILIVDNAPSTDATARLVRETFPKFRYVCEPRPGLDHARNRAIAETTGEIIAFTDDDVAADAGWVGALARAFSDDPAVGLVTGLAEPLELETRAQIYFERYGGFGRGCRRLYSQAPRQGRMPWHLVGAGQLGAGANMALRRDVLQHVGGFDPALDVGTPTLGGGDHDLFFRVLHAGHLCVYDPSAIVRHRHRRTVAELGRLFYSYGYATRCLFEREARNFPGDRPAIRRLSRWWWRHWAWARWWRSVFRPAWVPAPLVLAEIRGFVRGRGAYLPARRKILVNEDARPDPVPLARSRAVAHGGGAVGIFAIETAAPLRALDDAALYDSVEVIVQWHGRPLGSLRIASQGQPLSARRLADELSHRLWYRLLDPALGNDPQAYVRFGADFAARMPAGPSAAMPAGSRSPSVTVVVTTCNRPVALRRCLESLTQLQVSRPLQLIVVDNRPATASAAPVVRDFPGVELVIETRAGSSYARNAGTAAARSELVAMVDDDMIVTPEWLERLLAPFARADVMAVTGNTLAAQMETPAERLLESYGGFSRGYATRVFDSAWFHRNAWRAVPTWQIGGSGNLAFRREIFSWRRIGRFDETLGAGVPTGVGEDTKLFYDILAAGFTIVYEPSAVAWHYHRATMPALRQQLYAYSKGHVAYHLTTLFGHRDLRALVRIFFELPQAWVQRAWARVRGRSPFPLSLLLVELAGTLAGPWSLLRARRLALRIERAGSGRRRRTRVLPMPLLARKSPVVGAES